MIKHYFLIIICLLISPTLSAQQLLFFEGDWESLLKEAQNKQLNIYVGLFTPYCASCQEMDEKVYKDKEVAAFYNEHFINYKVDVHSELGELLASQNNIRSFPAHLYFSSEGEILHQAKGNLPSKVFIHKGEEALTPTLQLYTLKKKIQRNENLFLDDYINYTFASYDVGVKDDFAIEQVFKLLTVESLYDKKVQSVVSQALFTSDVNSLAFQFFEKNKSTFSSLFSMKKMESIYIGLARNTLSSSLKEGDVKVFTSNMTKLKVVLPIPIASRIAFTYEPRFYLSIGKEKEAFYSIQNNFQFIKDNPNDAELNKCNDWAWYFYQNSDNKEYLLEALNWVSFSIENHQSYNFLDTQAHLYYKLGRLEESENVAKKVQSHYIETGKDTTAISLLLSKIKIH